MSGCSTCEWGSKLECHHTVRNGKQVARTLRAIARFQAGIRECSTRGATSQTPKISKDAARESTLSSPNASTLHATALLGAVAWGVPLEIVLSHAALTIFSRSRAVACSLVTFAVGTVLAWSATWETSARKLHARAQFPAECQDTPLEGTLSSWNYSALHATAQLQRK